MRIKFLFVVISVISILSADAEPYDNGMNRSGSKPLPAEAPPTHHKSSQQNQHDHHIHSVKRQTSTKTLAHNVKKQTSTKTTAHNVKNHTSTKNSQHKKKKNSIKKHNSKKHGSKPTT